MNSAKLSKKILLASSVLGIGLAMASASLAFASADTTPPTTPIGLVATSVSTSQVNLTWTASTDNVGVTGYDIYRNGTEVGTTSATSYSDSGLAADTTYSYTVDAFDAAGNLSTQSTSVSATTLANTASPTIPTELVATAVSASQINLSWAASTDSAGVTGYDIYRNGTEVGTTAATSYSDTGLAASTGYTYTVAAFDGAGNNSGQSTSVSATTLASGTTVTTPSSYTIAPTIQIGANGSILIHGLTVTSVGTNTFTGTVWGITYTVNYSPSTTSGAFKFLLRGGNAASFNSSQIQVGDQIGVEGTISASSPMVIQGQIVRNYSIVNPRSQNHTSGYGNGNGAWNNKENTPNGFQNFFQKFFQGFKNGKGNN